MPGRPVAILETLFVVAMAALASVSAKFVLAEIRPFTFTWLQLSVGGAVLMGFSLVGRGERLPRGLPGRFWLKIAVMGVGNIGLVRLAFLTSLSRQPATTHAFLVNTVGLATMGVSALWLRERPSRGQVLGALTALGGLGLFLSNLTLPSSMVGVAAALGGVLMLAVTNNISRTVALESQGRVSSLMVATLAFGFGGLPLVALGLLVDGVPDLEPGIWAIIFGNGLIYTVVGPVVWNHVLRQLRSFELSLLAGSAVIWAALFAMPLLGEFLVPWQWLGALVMIFGLALTQRRGR